MSKGEGPPEPAGESVHTLSLHFDNFRRFVDCYASRVSPEGLFIETEVPLEVGSVVRFEIQLSDEFKLLRGLGEVVWKMDAGTSDEWTPGMAIRFQEIDDPSQRLIARLVDNCRRGGGTPFSLVSWPIERRGRRQEEPDIRPPQAEAPPGPAGQVAPQPPAAEIPAPQPPESPPSAEPETASVQLSPPASPPSAPPPPPSEPSPAAADRSADLAVGEPSVPGLPPVEELRVPELPSAPPPAPEPREPPAPPEPREAPEPPASAQAPPLPEPTAPRLEPGPVPRPPRAGADRGPVLDAAAPPPAPTAPPEQAPPPAVPDDEAVRFDPGAAEPAARAQSVSRRRRLPLWILLVLLVVVLVAVIGAGLAGEGGPLAHLLGSREQPAEEPAVAPPESIAAAPPPVVGVAAPEAEAAVGEAEAEQAAEPAEPEPTVPELPPFTGIDQLSWELSDGETVLVLTADGALAPDGVELLRLDGGNPRQIVKVLGVERPFAAGQLAVGSPQVARVRVGLHREGGRQDLHFVVDLASPGVRAEPPEIVRNILRVRLVER